MKKKALKFLVKLLISFGFLAWIIFRVNWQEVWALLRKIEPKFIVAYFVVLIAGIAVSVLAAMRKPARAVHVLPD